MPDLIWSPSNLALKPYLLLSWLTSYHIELILWENNFCWLENSPANYHLCELRVKSRVLVAETMCWQRTQDHFAIMVTTFFVGDRDWYRRVNPPRSVLDPVEHRPRHERLARTATTRIQLPGKPCRWVPPRRARLWSGPTTGRRKFQLATELSRGV